MSIEAVESPKLDDSGLDIVHALRGIRAALVENNIDVRVDEIATVAICQFGTFGMWKDLNDHWDVFEQSLIVRHLTHRWVRNARRVTQRTSCTALRVTAAPLHRKPRARRRIGSWSDGSF